MGKSKLKQALDILFTELEDYAAKSGKPEGCAFWVHRKALQYQDGRRGDHTYYRRNGPNVKEFWDKLIEQAFPKQNFGKNPNEGKLIAGYITGFDMKTYMTKARKQVWEFGAGDPSVSSVRSMDDIIAKKHWRGKNMKGGRWLCSCPKGQKCTCKK